MMPRPERRQVTVDTLDGLCFVILFMVGLGFLALSIGGA